MRILVVEDETELADALATGLRREGYAVDVAYDGIEGYDLASSEQFDVIILDLMLPGMDGIEICKKLREQKIHTPILMLTSKSQIFRLLKAEPFVLSKELVYRLSAYLGHSPREAEYFHLLVAFGEAESESDRLFFFEQFAFSF